MKNEAYIITEGQLDASLIRQLLPTLTQKPDSVKLLIGQGYSSALSLAQSVLLQTNQDTLLLVDADTNDPKRVKEKQEFIEQYVKSNGPGRFKVLLAIPSLEVIFFTDKLTLETVFNRSISDEVWELAKFSPRQALSILAGNATLNLPELLANDTLRHQIERTPLIQEVKFFIDERAMA